MVSEKNVETELSILLHSLQIDTKYIIETPNDNNEMKEMFKFASKNKTGHRGIPDKILLNAKEKICTVFELKCNEQHHINDAIKDLKVYKERLVNIDNQYQLYFIAFNGNDNYKLFDGNMVEMNNISLTDFIQRNYNDGNNINIEKYDIDELNNKIHKIHNYIRNYTRISDTDKPFFIAIILISLQQESFKSMIQYFYNDNQADKRYIYDLLSQSLQMYNLDISVFEPLRTDSNNKHILKIINMVRHIVEKCQDNTDLLNKFYTEFVKYNNLDSKSLGIVLTPDYIADLMIHMANINNDDIVLDLCTGTGTFLLKALQYRPKKVIGCEYKANIYSLAKVNMILRNIQHYELLKGDCFDYNFTATKSIINPPYSQKDHTELEFIEKQLLSIEDNGIVVVIIPSAKFCKESTVRTRILKMCKIHSIVKLHEQIFHNEQAAVNSAIIIKLVKCVEDGGHIEHVDKTFLVDYRNDGFTLKRTLGRLKNEKQFQNQYRQVLENLENNKNQIILNLKLDLLAQFPYVIDNVVDVKKLKLEQFELEYRNKLVDFERKWCCSISPYNKKEIVLKDHHTKLFTIAEMFHLQKKPDVKYEHVSLKPYVNCIAAKKLNNGVKEINRSHPDTTFYGNKIVLITGGTGGAGMAFYQEDDFNITSSTIVLSPKFYMTKTCGLFIANQLCGYKHIYNFGNGWSNSKIINSQFKIPWNCGSIDYQFIDNLFI